MNARLFMITAPIFFVILALPLYAANEIPFDDTDSIETIRQKIIMNGYDFTVKPTHIFTMNAEEKQQLLRRKLPVTPREISGAEDTGPLAEHLGIALPSSFDWRNQNGHSYVGPVKDQGACGSCYGFSATAAAEGTYNVSTNNVDESCADFSESYIIWTLGSMAEYYSHFFGCEGADYDYYELDALAEVGTIKDSLFPYTTTQPSETFTATAGQLIRFDSWYRITCSDIDAIKTAIMTYGTVDAAVNATSAFIAYESGIYQDTNNICSGVPCYYTSTNHAIALVGWDDNSGNGYWILRNSWGPDWGESGYMRIKYNSAAVSCAVAYLVPGNWTRTTAAAASSVIARKATMKGTVYPGGRDTTYYFEYGTGPDFGSTTQAVSAGSGTAGIEVSAELSGLTPATSYMYRLVAQSPFGFAYSDETVFSTTSTLPVVSTAEASSLGQNTATLNGTVNPNELETAYHFEYGATTAYGASTQGVSAGASGDSQAVTADITGLNAGTLYHYRLVAASSEGTSYGDDLTFTTIVTTSAPAPQPPDDSGGGGGGGGCFIAAARF